MISVRISQQEYESLKTLYASRGTRSISELAREAMKQVLSGAGNTLKPDLEARVQSLEIEVVNLNRQLQALKQ